MNDNIATLGCIIFVVFLFIVLFISFNSCNAKDYYKNLQNKDYYKNLQSTEWKELRKRILQRDGYKCRFCGQSNHLQVHHKYYNKYPNNKYVDPWNYPDSAFLTLCKRCHEHWHQTNTNKVYYKKYDIN